MSKTSVLIIGFVIIIIGGIYYLQKRPSKLDGFAQCLKEKKTIFYGAFWCTHCQNQKKLFGRAERFLNYVECSTPDGSKQTQECSDKGIKSYPTWEFADGTRENGEMTLNELSKKSGCLLP